MAYAGKALGTASDHVSILRDFGRSRTRPARKARAQCLAHSDRAGLSRPRNRCDTEIAVMSHRRFWLIGLLFLVLVTATDAASTRLEWLSRLKMLELALRNHEKTFGFLPHDLADELGKPFDRNQKPHLSWRVALLPFAEEDYLYKKFKFLEPWDSRSNKRLLDESRNIYTLHW